MAYLAYFDWYFDAYFELFLVLSVWTVLMSVLIGLLFVRIGLFSLYFRITRALCFIFGLLVKRLLFNLALPVTFVWRIFRLNLAPSFVHGRN